MHLRYDMIYRLEIFPSLDEHCQLAKLYNERSLAHDFKSRIRLANYLKNIIILDEC